VDRFSAANLLSLALADLVPALEQRVHQGGCPLCKECVGGCERRAQELLAPQAEAWAARFAAGRPEQVLASVIDHTLLKPDAVPAQIAALCEEARRYRFAAVCVNPRYVPQCVRALEGSGVAVCTVAGFPLGATTAASKAYEAREAIRSGAKEIDMVLAVGALKAGEERLVRREIARVVRACHRGGALCKVILETALLSDEEKVRACRLAAAAGADFVKTSTGFQGGATVYDVCLMRHTVGERMGVKAAGGIRTLNDALKMLVAGASRLGASAGVAIVEEARRAASGNQA
jgi:deoxyribose-phosphate aldolase